MEDNIKSYKDEIKALVEKATESFHLVRYNEKMLQFLCQQMNQVEKVMSCVPTQASREVLKTLTNGVRKASTLVTSHAKQFDFKCYYKADDVQEQVEALCSTFKDCFEDLGVEEDLGLETALDENCVEADRGYIH